MRESWFILKSIPYSLIIETYFFTVDLSQAEVNHELECNHLNSNYISKFHLHSTLKILLTNNMPFCYAKCSNSVVWFPAAQEIQTSCKIFACLSSTIVPGPESVI